MAKQKVKVTTFRPDGTTDVQEVEMDIEAIMKDAPEAEEGFWCDCTEEYETDFYDDEYDDEGNRISKHHYRCRNCQKVTQIG